MPVTEIEETPSPLGLYAKAAVSAVRPGGGGDGLPDEEVVLRDVEVDTDHLAAYDRVCGFDLSDRLPATYLHVIAFPLALRIMTRADFPFPLPGLVHVANRIRKHRPITVDERPTLKVHAADLRPHRKGQQLDLVATAEIADEVVWEDVSTYLKRGGGRDESATDPGPDIRVERNEAAPRWRVPGDIGRRYGAVSGDRNPIHLHPLVARAFGFPRHIAHGMWTKARCLAALAGRLPDAYTVDVRFERPVSLPTGVLFTTEVDGDTQRFGLHAARGDDRHLTGEVTIA
jgi:acyl dehydratase